MSTGERGAVNNLTIRLATWMILSFQVSNILASTPESEKPLWEIARRRSVVYEDCGRNAQRLLMGWIENKQDPQTHLFSKRKVWNYHNEAADHYASMVMIAHYVKPELNESGGRLHQTMVSCHNLCMTENGLLTLYDLGTMSRGPEASLDRLSEWLRDGLMRVAENMGTDNIWYEEFERLTDAMLAEADRRGGIAKTFTKPEFIGHMLQSLSRLYVMSGKKEYLLAAEELAEAQLADPDTVVGMATLWDHSCEMTPGLGEFLALEGQLNRPKVKEYAAAMRKVLDRLLEEHAHPQTGLLCNKTVDKNGNVTWTRPPNAWGYVLFTYQNYDQATGEGRYKDAVEKSLTWLVQNYSRRDEVISLWPYNKSSDAHSDSYESILSLLRRYPHLEGTYPLLDWMTLQHIHRRQPEKKYGPYTGGHFDGSTGRTLCIHMMLHSQGVRTIPFQEGLRLGGVQKDDVLYLYLDNSRRQPWTGRLRFDWPRNEYEAGRINWARINETPQWYAVRPGQTYSVTIDDQRPRILLGRQLIDGLRLEAAPNQTRHIRVTATLPKSG